MLTYGRPGSDRQFAQILDAEGLPVGEEIIVDEPFVGSQVGRAEDIDSHRDTGSWLAMWYGSGSPGSDTSLTSVKARLFDSSGTPQGLSFQVNTTELGVQASPKGAFLASGSFVIVFEDRPGVPAPWEVRARVFSSAGVPMGEDFVVSTRGIEGWLPDVVESPLGGFYVVWNALDSNHESLGIGISEFLSDGTPLTASVIPIPSIEGASTVTAEIEPDGRLSVAVADDIGKAQVLRVFRLIRSGLFWDVAETTVAPGGGFHGYPDLLPVPDGNVALVWLNNPSGTVGEGTNSVLLLSPENEPASSILDLNGDDPTRTAGGSDAAWIGGGLAVAVWGNTAFPGATCGLLARFFRVPEVMFEDGFESGDASRWSQVVE